MSINCIRTLLEDAIQTHSDKIALVFDEKSITYGELFTKVNQVAFYLNELGLAKAVSYPNLTLPTKRDV